MVMFFFCNVFLLVCVKTNETKIKSKKNKINTKQKKCVHKLNDRLYNRFVWDMLLCMLAIKTTKRNTHTHTHTHTHTYTQPKHSKQKDWILMQILACCLLGICVFFLQYNFSKMTSCLIFLCFYLYCIFCKQHNIQLPPTSLHYSLVSKLFFAVSKLLTHHFLQNEFIRLWFMPVDGIGGRFGKT